MRDHIADVASDVDEGLLNPDTVMPAQLFAEQRVSRMPERRLMAGVLEDAVRCYQRYRYATDGRSRRIYADAQEWFESRDTHPPFSFENICSTLGLDAQDIREGVPHWYGAQLDRLPSAAGRAMAEAELRQGRAA